MLIYSRIAERRWAGDRTAGSVVLQTCDLLSCTAHLNTQSFIPMDAAGHSAKSSEKSSEPPPHRWANLLGSAIALMTLMLPALAIAYYSTADLASFDQPPGLTPTWSPPTLD